MRILGRESVRRAVTMTRAIEAMRGAFAGLTRGTAEIPVRTPVWAPAGPLLVMPGLLDDPAALGTKLVSVVAGNRERGLPAIHATLLLVDPDTGRPLALMEAGWLTALRTGAASGLATDLLARPDARVLAVVGAGVQARTQIEAVRTVRPIEEVRVVSRGRSSAVVLAQELVQGLHAPAQGPEVVVRVEDSAAEALAGADVVVTATDAWEPVVADEAVEAGTHVNAVGAYQAGMRELPSELMVRARVVVDQVAAALEEAGDVVIPIQEGALRPEALVELGAVVEGSAPGRISADQVTVFKSVGSAAQDLALGRLVLDWAHALELGTEVDLDGA